MLKLLCLALLLRCHLVADAGPLSSKPAYEIRQGFYIVSKKVIRGPYSYMPVFTRDLCDCISKCTGNPTLCAMFFWIETVGGLNCFLRPALPSFSNKYQDHDFGGYGYPVAASSSRSPKIEADGYAYFYLAEELPYAEQNTRCGNADAGFRIGVYPRYSDHSSILNNYASLGAFWVAMRLDNTDEVYKWEYDGRDFNTTTFDGTLAMTPEPTDADPKWMSFYQGSEFKNDDTAVTGLLRALCQANPLGIYYT